MSRFGCWLTRRRLVEYLYGELSTEGSNRIKFHLEACSSCRKVWEELKLVSSVADTVRQDEPPAAFWEFYSGRVIARISEAKTHRRFGNFYGYKRILLPSLSLLLFFSIFLGSTSLYQVNREIEKHRELLQNVETIWNLDLVDELNQDQVFFSEPLDQPCKSEAVKLSKGDIWKRLHKFQQLPIAEQNLILANYEKWSVYPVDKRVISKRIYHILKNAGHPALKKLK